MGLRLAMICLAVIVAAGLAVAIISKGQQNRAALADGSTLVLKQVTLVSTNFSYSHSSRGRLWQLIEPILPVSIRQRFPSNIGSFGFGSDGSTNLIVITDLFRAPGSTGNVSIGRLRISDGMNQFDADWGASTMGWQNETVNAWQVRAFPRRGPSLQLEFLSGGEASTNWAVVARFTVPNPAAGQFPQWQPGARVQTDGDLTVRLASFRSGAVMDPPRSGLDLRSAGRKTEMLFTFEEGGQTNENWRVQKVVISDATGNHWFPYLDLESQRFSWAKGGQVEFFGALWPGENAWQLDVEASQIGGLRAEDQFSFETPLPAPAQITTLTNEWSQGGVSIRFVALASPNTDHTGDLQWTGKWWGEDKDKVYSLVLRGTPQPTLQKERLHLVSAFDQAGREVKLLEHREQDYSNQAFFLQPERDAEKVRLTFSLTRSRFVQFRARPEFVER